MSRGARIREWLKDHPGEGIMFDGHEFVIISKTGEILCASEFLASTDTAEMLDSLEGTCSTCGDYTRYGSEHGHCSWLVEKVDAGGHACVDDHWTPKKEKT